LVDDAGHANLAVAATTATLGAVEDNGAGIIDLDAEDLRLEGKVYQSWSLEN
jgi:hypothetical protein